MNTSFPPVHNTPFSRINILKGIAGIAALAVLILISLQNYLLFHSLVEIIGIGIAFTVFIIVWNTRRTISSTFFLIVGISLIFIGCIDLLHTLAFKGMGVFPNTSSDLPTQLWIAGRYFQSITFFIASLFIGRSLTKNRTYEIPLIITGCTVFAGLLLASIFIWNVFPSCFVEGSGLTPFKIYSEYIISLILIATVVIIYRRRSAFEPEVWQFLIVAQIFLILGELAFTSYTSVFGFMNMLGHIFRVISLYFFYRAFVVVSLTRPYDLLFRELKQEEVALRDTEQRLEDIISFLPDAIVAIDKDGRVIAWNKAIEQMTGITAGEMMGKGGYAYSVPFYGERRPILIDLVLHDDPATEKKYSGVQHTGRTITSETYIPTIFNGKGAYLWGTAAPLYNSAGSVIGAIEVIRDITVRKQEEAALIEAETRFRRISALMMDFAFSCRRSAERDFLLDWMTGAVEKTTHFTPEEIIRMGCWRCLVVEEDLPIFDQKIGGLQPGESSQCNLRIHTKNNDVRWILCFAECIRDPAHHNQHVLYGGCRDITEQKTADIALRAVRESQGIALKAAFAGTWDWDFPTGNLTWSPEFLELFGMQPGTTASFDSWLSVLHPDDRDAAMAKIDTSVKNHTYLWNEYRIILPGGKVRWIGAGGSTTYNESGEPLRMSGVCIDITDRTVAEESRRAYEARMNSAMELGNLAWWEMDLPDGSVRFDSRKATMIGFTPETFRHYSDFTKLVHPEDYESVMQAMRNHLEGRDMRYHADYRIQTADGDYRWFRDIGGITTRHSDGSVATVTGIVIDITESKKTKDALDASEIRFHALIQNSSDIIRILDQKGTIIYESPSAERILGYPVGFFVGKNTWDYIHPDDRERVRHDFTEVRNNTNPGIPTEFRIRRPDGSYLWVDSIGINCMDVPGIWGLVVTTRPIQHRKIAEEKLLQKQAQLSTAMDIAHMVNWSLDIGSATFTFDDRFYEFHGTTAAEEGGYQMPASRYFEKYVHPQDRMKIAEYLVPKIVSEECVKKSGNFEFRFCHRDGSIRTVLCRFFVICGSEGLAIKIFGINQDITDFKMMESEIRALNSALEQRVQDRTKDLMITNKKLEEEIAQKLEVEQKLRISYDEKVMLLKEIHHRVKNNLQIIASLLNLQSRSVKDESTLAAIRESQNRVKAIALVHEKLYRSENISDINLRDYIQYLSTGLFQFYDAQKRGIKFEMDITDVKVDIDTAIPLGLVTNELISNSLKYAFPEGRRGEVRVSVSHKDHSLVIIYQDTGIGIPADLDWQNTASLGLRLVTSLVDQMNGTIELDRSAGTRFTIVVTEKKPRESS